MTITQPPIYMPISPVIMPVLNNPTMTEEAIWDVIDQEGVDFPKLLIIDQGSGDTTRRMLEGFQQTHDHLIRLWRHDPPMPSLSATWNLALQWAWHAGAASALVINNDVRLPNALYARLRAVQAHTGAWFVSAVNMGDTSRYVAARDEPFTLESVSASRGGPDFSCFLITQECHRWFQFDEGFQPAYHEDNDYHRRLVLAGFGEKIFSVPVPYLHHGSGTLKDPANAALRAGWDRKFAGSRLYYEQKWGGPVGHETFTTGPYNKGRHSLFGQGRATYEDAQLGGYYDGQASL